MTDVVHICVAMKPIEGNFASNALEHGVAGLNIDGCRVRTAEALRVGSGGLLSHVRDGREYPRGRDGEASAQKRYRDTGGTNFAASPGPRGGSEDGRWPANVLHDGSDEVKAEFPETGVSSGGRTVKRGGKYMEGKVSAPVVEWSNDDPGFGDAGSAARFFQECQPDDEDAK